MLKLLLPCLLVLFHCTSVRAQHEVLRSKSSPNAILDSLSQELNTIASTDQVVGFGVALVNDEGIIFEQAHGYADYASKSPYTVHTVQNIASISKTFIGISLLQAESEGILSMDDPINKYLPFEVIHPRFPDQPILLKHLANHTAGISDDKKYEAAYYLLEPFTTEKGTVQKWEYKEMRKASKQSRTELAPFLRSFLLPKGALYHRKNFGKTAPGAVYEYSNVGAALAALVLESASSISFREWTKTRIFQPLGMKNTGWTLDDITPGTFFTHHFMNGEPMPNYALATYP
ncbi:MAG: serine hydrolase, partial [Bacteroidota bacterium]